MIYLAVWIGVAVALELLVAFMLGSGEPPKDSAIPPVLFLMAAFWPVAIALMCIMAPFMFAHHLGEQHRAAQPKDINHGQ